jgi:hypothetical protein
MLELFTSSDSSWVEQIVIVTIIAVDSFLHEILPVCLLLQGRVLLRTTAISEFLINKQRISVAQQATRKEHREFSSTIARMMLLYQSA